MRIKAVSWLLFPCKNQKANYIRLRSNDAACTTLFQKKLVRKYWQKVRLKQQEDSKSLDPCPLSKGFTGFIHLAVLHTAYITLLNWFHELCAALISRYSIGLTPLICGLSCEPPAVPATMHLVHYHWGLQYNAGFTFSSGFQGLLHSQESHARTTLLHIT